MSIEIDWAEVRKGLKQAVKDLFELVTRSAGIGFLVGVASLAYAVGTGQYQPHAYVPGSMTGDYFIKGIMIVIGIGLAIQLAYWAPFLIIDFVRDLRKRKAPETK